MSKQNQPSLEDFVHRALRELPAERAPAGLEDRVFAALASRRRVSRWQAGWRAWPVLPRTLVIASSAVIVIALAWLFLAGTQAVESFSLAAWLEVHAPAVAALGKVAGALGEALQLCLRKFHPWVLGGLAAMALAYALLFSLGSSLCRRLSLTR